MNFYGYKIKLTNGASTFEVELSPDQTEATDRLGSKYKLCTAGCEHVAPADAQVWHDEGHTDELWEAQ